MGVLFSRRTSLTHKERLEGLDNEIKQLTDRRQQNVYQERSFIGYLLILSFLFYLVGALVFYLYYSPKSWLEYGLYSIPLVLFPTIIYLVKKLLNIYFTHKKAQYDLELSNLQAEKRKILNEVMENETFNVAKELLQRYDPQNPILRETTERHGHDASPRRRDDRGELRQRRQRQQTAQTPHPALRPQPHPQVMAVQTVPRPSRPSQPHTLPSSPVAPPTASDMSNGEEPPSTAPRPPSTAPQPPSTPPQIPPHHTTQFIPPGMCLGHAPGPPTPSPILPRERTSLDKMVEYLVGDGPNNRYALVCIVCHSHNGMALKDEFEYMSFRCAYCYTLNPAKRAKPVLKRTLTPTTPVTSTPAAVTVERTLLESPADRREEEGGESGGERGQEDVTLAEEPAEVEGHDPGPDIS